MDAMILAAGLGTRLRPLTETMPKALIEVGGTPMLEIVARRVIAAGADRIVVNVHHHADQVRRFIDDRGAFGVDVAISDESEALLDTGGALRQAAPLLRRDEPFFLHNVDVISDIDLRRMYAAHMEHSALATLAVMDRDSTRYLLFDSSGLLCGYGNSATGFEHIARDPRGPGVRLGFSGVHVVDPGLLDLITETGAFSVITLYMRLVREGHRVGAHRVDTAEWIDIGRHEHLDRARSTRRGSADR